MPGVPPFIPDFRLECLVGIAWNRSNINYSKDARVDTEYTKIPRLRASR